MYRTKINPRAETLTLIPALIAFIISIYFAGLAIYVAETTDQQKTAATIAICTFITGIILTICWIAYWTLHKKLQHH